ncbi:hypothetical protein [Hymenobacter sp. APR13]|uniref:hypothetical protein n=1 Tax=Hymenobacter sp. APR13 TaxID=1356852 RepID=UPI0004E086F7|nr:hypothetical protein [Hymenobacter sp. APR13]AII52711.1 hypothetical protein N008_12090 [Hymenobacter sp. APR13]
MKTKQPVRAALPGRWLMLGLLVLAACASENTEDLLGNVPPTPACDPAANTYAAVVAPLLQQRCVVCHNNVAREGNVSLETHAQVQAVARNGLLVGVVSHAPGYKTMPQGGPKLSDCEIDHIRRWVDAGALNN